MIASQGRPSASKRRDKNNVDNIGRRESGSKNLSEPSEITLVHLNSYADYLREKNLDSKAVRVLLTSGGPRLMRVDGHLWPILDPDESGWHNYFHESSGDQCQ